MGDDLLVFALFLGGLVFAVKTRAAAAARPPAARTPGTPANPGTRDQWWNPGDPIYGPEAPQQWLYLLDQGGRRIYARAGRVFRSDASLVPPGELLYLAPEGVSRVLGSAYWADFLSRFGYDWVARVGMVWNGDGTFTDQLYHLTIGLDRLQGGAAG